MEKIRLGLVGCGFLGNIIVDAWRQGLLDEFTFVGCTSRTEESAQALATKAGCPAYADIGALLAQNPIT